jgi:ParB family transcriptional regulator, chromosome partitioning protein
MTQEVEISRIVPSKTNPRKNFDKGALENLTASIKAEGRVLFPILIRPLAGAKNKYELVDGERRVRAATAAGLKTIDAEIRKMTDEEALRAQLISFEQDEDIHPLEKAQAMQRMLYGAHLTDARIDALAEKLGKTSSYIKQQLKLLDLIDPAKKAFVANVLPLSHALLICRLQPREQERAFQFAVKTWESFDGDFRYSNQRNPDATDESFSLKYANDASRTVCSVKDLREFIDRRINLDLKQAAFDKKDAALLPKAGACVTCPKRSGFETELFADIAKNDVCTDPACYAAKQQAFLERLKKGLKADKKKYVEITRDYQKPAGHPGAITERSFKYVKGAPCKFARVGIYIDADMRGKTATICCAKKECKQHFGSLIAEKNRHSSGGPGPKARSAQDLEKERIEQVKRHIEVEVAEKLVDRMLPALVNVVPPSFNDKLWLVEMAEFIDGHTSNEFDDAKRFLGIKGGVNQLDRPELMQLINASLLLSAYEDRMDTEIAWILEQSVKLGMREQVERIRAEITEQVTKAHAVELMLEKDKVVTFPAAAQRGVCRVCGCTESTPCAGGCAWADKTETLCTNPNCLKSVRDGSKKKKAKK